MDGPADSIAGTHWDLRHRARTGAGGHGPIARHHDGSELVFGPDAAAEHDEECLVGCDADDGTRSPPRLRSGMECGH